MSLSQTAYASEIYLAVPAEQQDIYALHQQVWEHVQQHQELSHRPTILYRRDHGLVRVRVSGVPLRRALPSSVTATAGSRVKLSVRCALWRDQYQARTSKQVCDSRVRELLTQAGCRVDRLEYVMNLARGYKKKIQADITLPVADIESEVTVTDPDAFLSSWKSGIGRGKRFGFGMPVIQGL